MKQIIIVLVMLSLIVLVGCVSLIEGDTGKYDYCVEWDGWIDRDNMLFNCYDLNNTITPKCSWEIIGDDETLRVYHLEDLEFSPEYSEYNCSRYVKSIRGVK